MESYYFISKEFISRHFNVPMEFLGNYVITHRKSGKKSTYGLGMKIHSPYRGQANMFVDINMHKIAETSVSYDTLNQGSCMIYNATLTTKEDMLFLCTKYNEKDKNQQFSYKEIAATYQQWWFEGKKASKIDIPMEFPFISAEFFANIFGVELRLLQLRILTVPETSTIKVVYKIKESNLAIDIAGGKLIKVDKTRLCMICGNQFQRGFDEKKKTKFFVRMLNTAMVRPGDETEIEIEYPYEALKTLYHDHWYYKEMRPLRQERKYALYS